MVKEISGKSIPFSSDLAQLEVVPPSNTGYGVYHRIQSFLFRLFPPLPPVMEEEETGLILESMDSIQAPRAEFENPELDGREWNWSHLLEWNGTDDLELQEVDVGQ